VKAFLSARGTEFEERDVTRDPQAVKDLVRKYKSRMTPTVVIGDEVIIGFDEERILHSLET
jgi:glutaredoxin